jgi:hypothetical protein
LNWICPCCPDAVLNVNTPSAALELLPIVNARDPATVEALPAIVIGPPIVHSPDVPDVICRWSTVPSVILKLWDPSGTWIRICAEPDGIRSGPITRHPSVADPPATRLLNPVLIVSSDRCTSLDTLFPMTRLSRDG